MAGIESPARHLLNLTLTVDSFLHYRLGPSPGLQAAVPFRSLSSDHPRSILQKVPSCVLATAKS
jgi:hypothetical protein